MRRMFDATERALLLRADDCLLIIFNTVPQQHVLSSRDAQWLLLGNSSFSASTQCILIGIITAWSVVFLSSHLSIQGS